MAIKNLVIDGVNYGAVNEKDSNNENYSFVMTNKIVITVPKYRIESYNNNRNYSIKLKKERIEYRVCTYTELGLRFSGKFELESDAQLYADMLHETTGATTEVVTSYV